MGQVELGQRVVQRPQRARGRVRVAGGDGQRCTLGDRHTCVADDLGEGTEAHDLGAELLGDVSSLQ